jgi:hypothetical protein
MHELVKGARYYDSIFTLPKNKEVGDTIMGVADAHKHEIKNMNYGRALIEQLRFLWDMELDGYSHEIEPDLLLMLAQEFEGKPDDYNKMMLGVFKNDKEQIDRFLDLSQEIIDDINYEKKKEKPLEKMKFEKKKPIEPEEKEDDDDDFNPDDWDTFDFDDEDED